MMPSHSRGRLAPRASRQPVNRVNSGVVIPTTGHLLGFHATGASVIESSCDLGGCFDYRLVILGPCSGGGGVIITLILFESLYLC
jgi:hypothetical protein